MTKIAVIDLGSNSVRLQISVVDPGQAPQILVREKEYVRLSENMGTAKILQPEPIQRTMVALEKFQHLIANHNCDQVIGIATAAVRQAQNQQEFLYQVKQTYGFDFQVVTGEQEAFLDYLGVTRTFARQDCLILDTGGASTEIILVHDRQAKRLISLPFGSVNLTQRFQLEDIISAANLFEALTFAEMQLTGIKWLRKAHNLPLIVLGGSNRSIAKIDRRKHNTPKDLLPPVHGYQMSAQAIFALTSKLLAMDKKERANIPGLAKNRADIIIGGLIPINLLLRTLHITEVTFSNAGLREGVVFAHLENLTLPQ